MKLEYKTAESGLWNRLSATPVDFDAFPPVPDFRIQWTLGDANVDRTAVAASLIFSPWIAGRCDHLRPFSALTEQRLVEWFSYKGIWVAPTPVRAGGLPIPRGNARLWISDPTPELQDLALALVPPDGGSGQMSGIVRVASNASFFELNAPTREDAFCIRVGVATLLAESLHVDEIVDPQFFQSAPDDFLAVRRLLECVSIGLSHD